MKASDSQDQRFARMTIARVYPLYLTKVEKKGRTKEELDQVICWLTGLSEKALMEHIRAGSTFDEFFKATSIHPNAHLISGMICGHRVEEIQDPLTRKIRWLDKLVDELAKGRKMEKILRSS